MLISRRIRPFLRRLFPRADVSSTPPNRQPAQWIRVPDGEPPPVLLSSKHAFSSSSTPRPPVADPFSVPDNDYHDSWLDRLWINLFSDRMLAAVEGIQAGERGFRGQEGGDSPAGARAGADVGVAGSLDGEEEARARKSPRGVSNGRRISSERGSNARGSYTYEDYVTLAKRLQAGTPEGQRRVVRGILLSVFPGWFPALFRALFPPGKVRRRNSSLGSALLPAMDESATPLRCLAQSLARLLFPEEENRWRVLRSTRGMPCVWCVIGACDAAVACVFSRQDTGQGGGQVGLGCGGATPG